MEAEIKGEKDKIDKARENFVLNIENDNAEIETLT